MHSCAHTFKWQNFHSSPLRTMNIISEAIDERNTAREMKVWILYFITNTNLSPAIQTRQNSSNDFNFTMWTKSNGGQKIYIERRWNKRQKNMRHLWWRKETMVQIFPLKLEMSAHFMLIIAISHVHMCLRLCVSVCVIRHQFIILWCGMVCHAIFNVVTS